MLNVLIIEAASSIGYSVMNQYLQNNYLVHAIDITPLKVEKLSKLIYKVSIKKNPKYLYKVHHNIGLKLLSILHKRLQSSIIKIILK